MSDDGDGYVGSCEQDWNRPDEPEHTDWMAELAIADSDRVFIDALVKDENKPFQSAGLIAWTVRGEKRFSFAQAITGSTNWFVMGTHVSGWLSQADLAAEIAGEQWHEVRGLVPNDR